MPIVHDYDTSLKQSTCSQSSWALPSAFSSLLCYSNGLLRINTGTSLVKKRSSRRPKLIFCCNRSQPCKNSAPKHQLKMLSSNVNLLGFSIAESCQSRLHYINHAAHCCLILRIWRDWTEGGSALKSNIRLWWVEFRKIDSSYYFRYTYINWWYVIGKAIQVVLSTSLNETNNKYEFD